MLNDIGLPGIVAPVQGEHVAIDLHDNRFPPTLANPFVGDDQMARSDLVPAARQPGRSRCTVGGGVPAGCGDRGGPAALASFTSSMRPVAHS